MNDQTSVSSTTDLTTAAQAKALEEATKHLPHRGELFVPDDTFYAILPPKKRAEHMLKLLCKWLGIKPGYIRLVFERGSPIGGNNSRFDILITKNLLHNELSLGKHLGEELVRYLIEHQKQLVHNEPAMHRNILAEASIVSGLGVVILNGWGTYENILNRVKNSLGTAQLFGGPYQPAVYAKKLQLFLTSYRIEPIRYEASLAPWTAKRLNVSKRVRSTKTMQALKHHVALNNMKLLGVMWVFIMLVFITSFVWSQQDKPASPEIAAAQQKVVLLNSLRETCHKAVSRLRQYTDQQDIQSERALQSQELRCQSLENQFSAAEAQYNQLKR